MAANQPFKVLYVCTGNTARSPIAAACMKSLVGSNGDGTSWTVGSAGIEAHPGEPVRPEALAAASGLGLDVTAHRSAKLDAADCEEPDLILAMSWDQVAHIWSLVPESWPKCFTIREFIHWAKRARTRPPILFANRVEQMKDRVDAAHIVRKRARADHGFWGGLRPQDLNVIEPSAHDRVGWDNLATAMRVLVTDVVRLLEADGAGTK